MSTVVRLTTQTAAALALPGGESTTTFRCRTWSPRAKAGLFQFGEHYNDQSQIQDFPKGAAPFV